jgi:hypothetical protein
MCVYECEVYKVEGYCIGGVGNHLIYFFQESKMLIQVGGSGQRWRHFMRLFMLSQRPKMVVSLVAVFMLTHMGANVCMDLAMCRQ